jgi:general secretion pathway protein N
MKKLLAGTVFFLLALAGFLVATLPARYALQFLPANIPLQVHGADGTLWNGHAQQVVWDHYPIGEVSWKLHALPLLLGRANAYLTIKGQGINAKGNVTAYRDQTLELDNALVTADLTRLPLPRHLMATPGGNAIADIQHATIQNRWPTTLDARIDWKPARVLSPMELELGTATLQVSGKDGKLDGELQSQGALKATGKLSLTQNGAFSANIKITPTNKTPRELRDMLPMVGRPDSKGTVTIRQSLQLGGFPL